MEWIGNPEVNRVFVQNKLLPAAFVVVGLTQVAEARLIAATGMFVLAIALPNILNALDRVSELKYPFLYRSMLPFDYASLLGVTTYVTTLAVVSALRI